MVNETTTFNGHACATCGAVKHANIINTTNVGDPVERYTVVWECPHRQCPCHKAERNV